MTREELKQYSDTRLYNLILCLGADRLEGWFVPFGHADRAPVRGISATWTYDPGRTLELIENAVYDNPLLLEDYECRLLVDTPRQLVFPPDSPTELVTTAMERFYEAGEQDIFLNPLSDASLAFSLCPGLKSFLSRTFAGIIPTHRLEPLARWCAADNSAPGTIRVYADLDEPWLHLLAYSGNRLLHASTHRVEHKGGTTADSASDAAYFIFALWRQLGLGMDSGQLNVSGSPAMRRELMPLLRRHINYVGLTLLPRMEAAESVPTPVLLTAAGWNR